PATPAADSLCGFAPLRENKSHAISGIAVVPTEGAYVRISKFCNDPYPPVEPGGYNIDRAYGSPSFPIPIRASLHQFREANLCERRFLPRTSGHQRKQREVHYASLGLSY